jgi:SulP family sulfate permease
MLERDEERKRQASAVDLAQAGSEEDNEATPVPRHASLDSMGQSSEEMSKHDLPHGHNEQFAEDEENASSALRRFLSDGDVEQAGEATALLGRPRVAKKGLGETMGDWKRRAGKITGRDVVQGVIVEPITLLPATILGLLLNVLDGVSYGMIL